jgi:hypothetical protein
LKALAQIEFVRLLYDYHAGTRSPCDSVRLFRSESPIGAFAPLITLSSPTGVFDDEKIVSGHTYYYRMVCDYDNGTSSGYVESPGATPSSDPFPPEARMHINHGASFTKIPDVQLTFSPLADADPGEPDTFSDIKDVWLSNTPDFASGGWQTFVPGGMPWNLGTMPPGGLAHVYARFRDTFGNESVGVEVASIRFELITFLPSVRR